MSKKKGGFGTGVGASIFTRSPESEAEPEKTAPVEKEEDQKGPGRPKGEVERVLKSIRVQPTVWTKLKALQGHILEERQEDKTLGELVEEAIVYLRTEKYNLNE